MANTFQDKAERFYLEQANLIAEEEKEEKKDKKPKAEKEEKEEKEPKDEKDEDEGEDEDPMKDADDVISKLELDEIGVDAKLEIISAIIESVQNTAEGDEEFSDFMNSLAGIIDEYETGEEEEAPMEEPIEEPMGGEEDMGAMPPAEGEEQY